jgi:hypothetical protein
MVSLVAGLPAWGQSAPIIGTSGQSSPLLLVNIGGNSSLAWEAFDVTAGTGTPLPALGRAGNHLIPGSWQSSSFLNIGVVSKNQNGNIDWTILDSQGASSTFVLGSGSDKVIAGGDFNGNGILDAATAGPVGKNLHWHLRTDPYAGGGAAATEIQFCSKKVRAFYFNPNGRGDALACLSGEGKKRIIRYKRPSGGAVKFIRSFPGFAATTSQLPQPLRTAGGTDLLVFSRSKGAATEVVLIDSRGKRRSKGVIPAQGQLVIGQFLIGSGEQVAVHSGSTLTVFDPVTRAISVKPAARGIAVDLININSFDGGGSGGGNNGGGNGGGGNETPPPNLGQGCTSLRGWPSGYIYKTIGSTHFTDVRRNTIGVVIKPGISGNFPDCIEALDSNGNSVVRLGLYARGAGWTARYYAGIGCGSSTPFNGQTVANLALQSSGSKNIVVNFGGQCFGPIDASKCIGSQQC